MWAIFLTSIVCGSVVAGTFYLIGWHFGYSTARDKVFKVMNERGHVARFIGSDGIEYEFVRPTREEVDKIVATHVAKQLNVHAVGIVVEQLHRDARCETTQGIWETQLIYRVARYFLWLCLAFLVGFVLGRLLPS